MTEDLSLSDAPYPAQAEKKYDARFAEMARNMCRRLGCTDADLAIIFGVHQSTISRWKVLHLEFGEALEVGKEVADQRVERSLYQRALGYNYDSEKVFYDHKKSQPVRVPIVVHVPADTLACRTWLTNRQPDKWRDKVDVTATFKPAEVTDEPLSLEEWDKRYAIGHDKSNTN